MCVLIVDDNADTRENLRTLLAACGYPGAQTVASGTEALAHLKAMDLSSVSAIDVVLSDLNMPGLSGIEVCREIKASPALRDLPVLILTGLPNEATLEEAFAAGACDFLAKPVRPNELLARVRSAMNLKRELDQRKARERELVEVTQRLKRLNEDLHRLSTVDELTGVANRRFFNVLLEREWSRAARVALPLSLIMIDIDFFKDYNDHYGHPQGDRCLARVAAALAESARRPSDCVARYGGEEFVVLLAHTDAPGALAVAERLRRQVLGLALQHPASAVHDRVTISLGVATSVPDRTNTAESLLTAADQAMYQAKTAGRNRAVAFSPA